MAETRTTGELRKAGEISDAEINAAVEALLVAPETGPYPIGGGYLLDLAAAVAAHEPARKALAEATTKLGFRRTIARTALLLARPTRA